MPSAGIASSIKCRFFLVLSTLAFGGARDVRLARREPTMGNTIKLPRSSQKARHSHHGFHFAQSTLQDRGSTVRIDRRKFLKTSGGALVGSGALAGILATGRAPAYAQNTTLHWLRLGDFVPASDTLLRQELLPQAEKALGLKITFETINGNDLQARITSAIQSGTGADIIHAMHNWPHLYAESVADVSDVAEEIAGQQGGFYGIFPALT